MAWTVESKIFKLCVFLGQYREVFFGQPWIHHSSSGSFATADQSDGCRLTWSSSLVRIPTCDQIAPRGPPSWPLYILKVNTVFEHMQRLQKRTIQRWNGKFNFRANLKLCDMRWIEIEYNICRYLNDNINVMSILYLDILFML